MYKVNVLRVFSAGLLAAALGLGANTGAIAGGCNPEAMGLIKNLSGSWSGSGTVKPLGGTQGRISCRVSYGGSGGRVKQKISCRGSDYNFEASARVRCTNSSLSGVWDEKVANNTGSVKGKIDGSKLSLELDSPNFQGRIAVRVSGSRRHSLTITQFDPAAGRQVPVAKVSLRH